MLRSIFSPCGLFHRLADPGVDPLQGEPLLALVFLLVGAAATA
jgi:hypothetical protein